MKIVRIKFKLIVALGLLFAIIVLLAGGGSLFLRRLARDSQAIIQDNYRTLNYMNQSDAELDALLSGNPEVFERSVTRLDTILHAQLMNVTEAGESEMTRELVARFLELKAVLNEAAGTSIEAGTRPYRLIFEMKEIIDDIYVINEEAILQRNEEAGQTARNQVVYMTIVGSAGIVTGYLILIFIPGYIANPIERFTEAINEIIKGNYAVKLPVKSKDEFGELGQAFNKMAEKLNEYEHSNYAHILSEKRRLEAVIDQMHEGVLGLDGKMEVIFANKNLLGLLGLADEEVLGKYAPQLAEKNQLLKSLINEVMVGFEPWEERSFAPIKIVEKGKQKLYAKNIIDITEQRAGEERKVLIGHVVILSDVTEFAEKDLAKTQFMATLSHELKTPAAAIELSSNLLRNKQIGQLNSEQESLLSTIEDHVARIRRIINELLDLSKIEAGHIDINIGSTSPSEIVNDAEAGVNVFLKEKAIVLEKQIHSTRNVLADRHKLIWVLNNFLTNAIRYTEHGSRIIMKSADTGNCVQFEVSDFGPGITAQDQLRIFRKFSGLSDATKDGTGLGLAISKEFIEAMGGNIGVSSQEGKGSTFWLKLPGVQA